MSTINHGDQVTSHHHTDYSENSYYLFFYTKYKKIYYVFSNRYISRKLLQIERVKFMHLENLIRDEIEVRVK